MKIKITLLLTCFLTTTALFAQLQKGNLILGGNALAENQSRNGGSDFVIGISPSISILVSDRLALGGNLNFFSVVGGGSNFGISAMGRFYLSNQNSSAWYLHGDLGLLTGGGSTTTYIGNAGVGLDIFLSPNFALETQIGAGFLDEENSINGNFKVFNLGTGFKFFFNRFPEEVFENKTGILTKGNLFLGATTGNINLISRTGNTITNISINPNIGKFVSNNLVIGANVNLASSSVSGADANSFQVQIAPFARYYPNAERKSAALFAELGGGFSLIHFNSSFFENITQTGPVIFGGVGLDFFLSPAIAFEIKGNYRYIKQREFDKQSNIGLNLGFQFFLNKGETVTADY